MYSIILIIVIVVSSMLFMKENSNKKDNEIAYTELITKINEEKVEKIEMTIGSSRNQVDRHKHV